MEERRPLTCGSAASALFPWASWTSRPSGADKNAASSMGSNFGSVPYNNTVAGNLSEFHFSQQNSRLGFRADGDWKGVHFIGYNEFDFNGTSGANFNLAVSKWRHCSPSSPVLGRCSQRKDRVPCRPELEHDGAQPQGHFRLARRSLLLSGHRHQLHCRPHLDAATRHAGSVSPQR